MEPKLQLDQATQLLNPSYDKHRIEAAYKSDAEVAAAEFGGMFRSDVSAYLADDVIDRATCPVNARGYALRAYSILASWTLQVVVARMQ
jgi:hypothetical protein